MLGLKGITEDSPESESESEPDEEARSGGGIGGLRLTRGGRVSLVAVGIKFLVIFKLMLLTRGGDNGGSGGG